MREPAGLRVQAALADSIGLRSFLGPTGFFRQYHDRIPTDLDEDDLPSLWAQDPPAAGRGLPMRRKTGV